MASFTAKDVQALRKATGAGMMDAKRALEENEGDATAAAKWLREKGIAKAAARSDRENTEGVVAIAVVDGVGAIVELKCETDFVAKSDQFVALANELAELVAREGEEALASRAAEVEDLKITLKENIEVGRVVRMEAAEGDVLAYYLHMQEGRGVNAVLVELAGGDEAKAREVAMHAAFTRPSYLSREEVPADVVAAERETLLNITRNEGKPEQAWDKIVEGRLTGWFKEHTLLEQKWVKDEKQTVAKMLGDARIVRFAQVEIGR